jgi:PAS domain S-box-containing protein
METPDRNGRQAPTDSNLALQAVIGHSPMAIVAIDLNRNVTLWNPAAERMFGWTEFEVIGRPYPAVPDSDQEAYRKQVEAELAEQSFSDLEVQRRRKDGSIFPAQLSVAPLKDESGMIVGSVSILADITERKRAENALRESEARFRTLVEHAPEAITMLDVDTGLYVDANPMAETLHGLLRHELIGKIGPADLSPKIQLDGRPSSEVASDYLSRALAGEFPRFEWMHLAPDGQETLCEVSLARLPDPHRNLVRASISDITERKAAEAQRAELEAKLAQAQKLDAVGQLTAGVAHDFNNLLAVIQGNAEILALRSPEHRPLTEAILRATTRGTELTQHLLAFSRQQPLRPQPIDMAALVVAMSDLLARTLGETIEIETVAAPDL